MSSQENLQSALDLGDKYVAFNQRLEDLKWYIGIFAAVISLLFAGLAVMLGLNLSSERSSLKDYKDSLRQELIDIAGSNSTRSNILLQTYSRQPLDLAEIPGSVHTDTDGKHKLTFRVVLRNDGRGRSGPMYAKFYSTDFALDNEEIDGTGYSFETFITPEKFAPSELFGGASIGYTLTLGLVAPYKPRDRPSELMVRYFYGNGLKSEARFRVKVETTNR